MWFLLCKNIALKYVFSWGCALGPTRGGTLTAPLEPIRLVEMGEVGEVSPGPATFQGPAVAEKNKSNCPLSISLINKNFTVRYGSYAVCVFIMSDARHCTGIWVEY